ncbi:unnamed protein product [Dicrocoelium dendriticum]|nr:unnamed protein product [Dicrocoelium dendriticum]
MLQLTTERCSFLARVFKRGRTPNEIARKMLIQWLDRLQQFEKELEECKAQPIHKFSANALIIYCLVERKFRINIALANVIFLKACIRVCPVLVLDCQDY